MERPNTGHLAALKWHYIIIFENGNRIFLPNSGLPYNAQAFRNLLPNICSKPRSKYKFAQCGIFALVLAAAGRPSRLHCNSKDFGKTPSLSKRTFIIVW